VTLRLQDPPGRRPPSFGGSAGADELRRLIALVAQGDRDAFSLLYEAVTPGVYGIALRTLRDPAHAEEVAQEVLLEVWRTASAYRPQRGEVTTWVLTIAHRRAVDRVRSAQAASLREIRVARQERYVSESAADETERRLDIQQVRSALAELSPVQRESLVLAYYGGHSQRQIADTLGVPLGTVKTRMRDGLQRLRVLFEAG
jgi:RNA polymerase sigma-70 factor (ECF subfamily)